MSNPYRFGDPAHGPLDRAKIGSGITSVPISFGALVGLDASTILIPNAGGAGKIAPELIETEVAQLARGDRGVLFVRMVRLQSCWGHSCANEEIPAETGD